MKKFLACFSTALCVIMGTACLSACAKSTEWLRPHFTFDREGVTIKFLDNTEEDFDFPIEGVKLNHSNYERENIVEYMWVIYDGDNLIGWIEAGNGYDNSKKGDYKYGYCTTYADDVYGYHSPSFLVVLKSTDLTVFDYLEITSDYGSVEKLSSDDINNPFSATERFNYYDEQLNEMKPAAGSASFVCCFYNIILEDIEAPGIKDIHFTLSMKSE